MTNNITTVSIYTPNPHKPKNSSANPPKDPNDKGFLHLVISDIFMRQLIGCFSFVVLKIAQTKNWIKLANPVINARPFLIFQAGITASVITVHLICMLGKRILGDRNQLVNPANQVLTTTQKVQRMCWVVITNIESIPLKIDESLSKSLKIRTYVQINQKSIPVAKLINVYERIRHVIVDNFFNFINYSIGTFVSLQFLKIQQITLPASALFAALPIPGYVIKCIMKLDTYKKNGVINYWDGSRYEGEMVNDKSHGKGKYTNKHGSVYEGKFEKDKIVEGTWKHAYNGQEYKGQFKDYKCHGKGTLKDTVDRTEVRGTFENDQCIKYEYRKYSDGAEYEGEFDSLGNPNGFGTLKRAKTTFIGTFILAAIIQGRTIYPSGDIYEGPYINGQPFGQGKLTIKRTGLVVKGMFINGKFMNSEGKYSPQDYELGNIDDTSQFDSKEFVNNLYDESIYSFEIRQTIKDVKIVLKNFRTDIINEPITNIKAISSKFKKYHLANHPDKVTSQDVNKIEMEKLKKQEIYKFLSAYNAQLAKFMGDPSFSTLTDSEKIKDKFINFHDTVTRKIAFYVFKPV